MKSHTEKMFSALTVYLRWSYEISTKAFKYYPQTTAKWLALFHEQFNHQRKRPSLYQKTLYFLLPVHQSIISFCVLFSQFAGRKKWAVQLGVQQLVGPVETIREGPYKWSQFHLAQKLSGWGFIIRALFSKCEL